MNRIILAALLLFVSAAHADYPDYENTDKIRLYVLGKNDERHEEEFIVNGPTVTVFIKIDLENITQVDFIDVSTAIECRDWKPSPPSTIAAYKVAPNETTNLKEAWFHMRLPCGAYHDSFYYVIQVKTLQGNYYSRKKFPAKLLLRPGRKGTTP